MSAPLRSFAILLASRAIGGEERFLVELAIAMRRTSTRPSILNLKAPMPYPAELREAKVRVIQGLARHRVNLLGVFSLARRLRELRPEVLLINSNRQAMILGAAAARLARIPVVLTHTHDHLGRAATTTRWLALHGDGLIVPAASHRSRLCETLRLPASRVARIYPGIGLSRTAAAAHEDDRPRDPTVGIVAALRPEKDHETFLRAAALIANRLPAVRFEIVGDGPRRAGLERLAAELGLGTRVSFAGWQPVNGALLGRFDALALSSAGETFPAVILEAFSAGVPVAATDVGSVAELAGSPPCASLVPPGNAEALAGALVSLLQDRDGARRLAATAARRVRYFSADRFCRDMLALSAAILDAKGRAADVDLATLADAVTAAGVEAGRDET